MTQNLVLSPEVQLLERARRLVGRGWTKEAFERRHFFLPNSYCVIGALRKAAGEPMAPQEPGARSAVYYAAYRALKAATVRRCSHADAMLYNDHPSTTKAAVLALIDDAVMIAMGARTL